MFFTYDNQSENEVNTMEEAKLVTAEGKSIQVFFLAFTGAPPKLPPKEKTSTSLRFSVHKDEVVGDLSLEIRGKRVPIKTGSAFDPETISNQSTQEFGGLKW